MASLTLCWRLEQISAKFMHAAQWRESFGLHGNLDIVSFFLVFCLFVFVSALFIFSYASKYTVGS